MSTERDQAKLIAERVARRVKGGGTNASPQSSPRTSQRNGAPVPEELSAIRAGLHDLEGKLDRIESKIVSGAAPFADQPRARVIDFISSTPPLAKTSSIASTQNVREVTSEFVPPTQSPWLASMSSMYTPQRIEQENLQSAVPNPQAALHPSQERFGVEEAAVTELVEFFEGEKKCSVDPSGQPCDHCAMCSSRGF